MFCVGLNKNQQFISKHWTIANIFKLLQLLRKTIFYTTDKNDDVVKITLPKNNNSIIANKYQLYLPTEKQLIDEVKKEIEKLDNNFEL